MDVNLSAQITIEQWCIQNISPQAYYIPSGKGLRRGGVGWEITSFGSRITIRIDNEQLLILFLLLYGHTGIMVRNETIPVS